MSYRIVSYLELKWVEVALVKSEVRFLPPRVAFRYRERLRELLEDERSQRRRSWQLGLGALEQQQILLLEAQHSATEVLKETDTCMFIQRWASHRRSSNKTNVVTPQ